MIKKINFKIFIKKLYLFEILIIIILGNFILNDGSFNDLLMIFPRFISYSSITTKAQRFDWRGFDNLNYFIEKNLDIEDKYDESIYGKRKAFWPDGNIIDGPTYLSPKEKKPYYLFNINVYYPAYNLRLFRNFTKGDGTPEFAEKHKEIKAVVFYQKDLDKVLGIKRKIKKIILQEDRYKIYIGNCTINNGIWRIYRTNLEEDKERWRFIPSDSSGFLEYSVIPNPNGFGYVHYLESPKIIDKSYFRGEYYFSIKDVRINPLLPFEIVCDNKTNYPGINIITFVKVFDAQGRYLTRLSFGGGWPSEHRGIWSKETSGNISPELRKHITTTLAIDETGTKKEKKDLKFIFELEKICVAVTYKSNKNENINTLGFQPLGILLFDD